MQKKYVFISIAIVVLLVGIAVFAIGGGKSGKSNSSMAGSNNSSQSNPTTATTPPTQPPASSESDANCPVQTDPTISYTGSAFEPACVKVASGTKVTWKNTSSQELQLGANPHPSHTGNREVSNNLFTLDIPAGGTDSSQLTTKGQHGFHNHLNPGVTGLIVVQ
jgi:plastocyanin